MKDSQPALQPILMKDNDDATVINILQSKSVEEIVNMQDINGDNALHIAFSRGLTEVVKNFLETKDSKEILRIAKMQNHHRDTVLHLASYSGSKDIGALEALLQSTNCEEIVKIRDASGMTALHVAAEMGRFDIAAALLQSKNAAEIANIRDVNGNTVLDVAVKMGRVDIAAALLRSAISQSKTPDAVTNLNGGADRLIDASRQERGAIAK